MKKRDRSAGHVSERAPEKTPTPTLPLAGGGRRAARSRARQKSAVPTDFTRNEIETGRRLFAGDWRFVAAASSPSSLPPMRGTEIAFAGRSNVGKSSLINALTGRKALARTSRTPGRTQELIFFTGGGDLNIVDMPGYGYAAAAKSKIAAWTALIEAYLRGRANLARVYVLIDARHGLKDTDEPTFEALGQAAVSYQIVLTKADDVKRGRAHGAASPKSRRRWPSGRAPSPAFWSPRRAKAPAWKSCAPPLPGFWTKASVERIVGWPPQSARTARNDQRPNQMADKPPRSTRRSRRASCRKRCRTCSATRRDRRGEIWRPRHGRRATRRAISPATSCC